MLGREISHPASPSLGALNITTFEELGAADVASGEPDAELAVDFAWDPLLIAVAGYLLTAVGRVHQLFPVLETLHPATLTALAALVALALDRSGERHLRDVFFGPTRYIAALLVWM